MCSGSNDLDTPGICPVVGLRPCTTNPKPSLPTQTYPASRAAMSMHSSHHSIATEKSTSNQHLSRSWLRNWGIPFFVKSISTFEGGQEGVVDVDGVGSVAGAELRAENLHVSGQYYHINPLLLQQCLYLGFLFAEHATKAQASLHLQLPTSRQPDEARNACTLPGRNMVFDVSQKCNNLYMKRQAKT